MVTCQNEKSQLQNKASAMIILKAKLLALKKAEERAHLDELRGDVQGSWGDQMRNYVLHPYQIVKDLRTEYEIGNPQAVFDGDIDAFLEAGIRWRRGADSRRQRLTRLRGGRRAWWRPARTTARRAARSAWRRTVPGVLNRQVSHASPNSPRRVTDAGCGAGGPAQRRDRRCAERRGVRDRRAALLGAGLAHEGAPRPPVDRLGEHPDPGLGAAAAS